MSVHLLGKILDKLTSYKKYGQIKRTFLPHIDEYTSVGFKSSEEKEGEWVSWLKIHRIPMQNDEIEARYKTRSKH